MEKYYLQGWGHISLPDHLLAKCEDGEEIINIEWRERLITKASGKEGDKDTPLKSYRKVSKVIHLLSEDLVSERFDLMIYHRGDHRILWLDQKGKRFGVR